MTGDIWLTRVYVLRSQSRVGKERHKLPIGAHRAIERFGLAMSEPKGFEPTHVFSR